MIKSKGGFSMSRKPILALIFILGIAVAAFLLPALAPQAHAQQGCLEFRAIGHGTLPSPHPLSPYDTWGADIWGYLGGEFLSGYVTGNDGATSWHGVTGTGPNGSYTYVFGADTFVVEIAHATFPFPPGKAGLGYYRGAGKIVDGTGRFQNAWGNIDWEAPFIVYANASIFIGRANFEIRGNICGIQ
jgi:hypothetical protein